MLAMDKPIAAEILWPATVMAATTICNTSPMLAPMKIWFITSTKPAADVGSSLGQSYRGYMSQVRTKPNNTRKRTFTAFCENSGAVSNSPEMRNIGHKNV